MSAGVLAVWTDVAAAAEADFNEWYDREHLAERVAVPGFRTGQRYRAADGATPRYLAWYETDSPAVLASPDYRARLDQPTPWTRRVMPHFRNTTRCIFGLRARFGQGRGAFAATLRLPAGQPPPGWLSEEALASVAARPGIVGAQWWVAAGEAATGDTAESRLRGRDASAAGAVLVEAAELEALRRAQEDLADRRGFETYALLYALSAAVPLSGGSGG